MPLRTLAVSLRAPRFRLPVSLGMRGGPPAFLTALDCPEIGLLDASASLGLDSGPDAGPRHFVSKQQLQQLLRACPQLCSGALEAPGLAVRKDGYLEASKQ